MASLLETIAGQLIASIAIVSFVLWPIRKNRMVLEFYFPARGSGILLGPLHATHLLMGYIFLNKTGNVAYLRSLLLSTVLLIAFFLHGVFTGQNISGDIFPQILVSWIIMNYIGDIISIQLSLFILSSSKHINNSFLAFMCVIIDFLLSTGLFFLLIFGSFITNSFLFSIEIDFSQHYYNILYSLKNYTLNNVQGNFIFFSLISTLISSIITLLVVLASLYKSLAILVNRSEELCISDVQAHFIFFCSYICFAFSGVLLLTSFLMRVSSI